MRLSALPALFALMLPFTVACGSQAGAPEPLMLGEYRATSAGDITSINFPDETHYTMVRTDCSEGAATCTSSGTYEWQAYSSIITFTDSDGVVTTYPFEALSSAPPSVRTLSLRILGGLGGPSTGLSGSTGTVGGGTGMVGGGTGTVGGGTGMVGNGSGMVGGSASQLLQALVALVQQFQMGSQGFSGGGDAGGGSGGSSPPPAATGGVDAGGPPPAVDAGHDAHDAASDAAPDSTP